MLVRSPPNRQGIKSRSPKNPLQSFVRSMDLWLPCCTGSLAVCRMDG